MSYKVLLDLISASFPLKIFVYILGSSARLMCCITNSKLSGVIPNQFIFSNDDGFKPLISSGLWHLPPGVGQVNSPAPLGSAWYVLRSWLARLVEDGLRGTLGISRSLAYLPAFVYTAVAGNQQRAESTLFLESWAHNWHENTSTSLCGLKCIVTPAQTQRVERETPPLDGKSCRVTLQRSETQERVTDTAVFATSPPELPSPGTLISIPGGENQAFVFWARIPDDSAKSLKDRPWRALSILKACHLHSAL